jgi:hypothetical protein
VDRIEGHDLPAPQSHHPAFYWFLACDAYVLALPLIAQGFRSAWAGRHEPVRRAIVWWSLAGLALSLFAVKEPFYFYPVMPVGAVLAVLGARAIAGGARFSWWPFVAALASLPWLAAAAGGPAPPLWAWLGAWTLFAIAWASATRWPLGSPVVAAALVAMVIVGGVVREAQRLPMRYHDPGYRGVAQVIAPLLTHVPPERVSVRAPEAPAFGYYLMHAAGYWPFGPDPDPERRLFRMVADPDQRVFVVDPTGRLHGGAPDSITMHWLESSTLEITREVRERTGRPLAVRVFVRFPGRLTRPR